MIFAGKPYIYSPQPEPRAPPARAEAVRGNGTNNGRTGAGRGMGRIIKALAFLAVIGFAALVGYAYLGDLAPRQTEIRQPVVLDAR